MEPLILTPSVPILYKAPVPNVAQDIGAVTTIHSQSFPHFSSQAMKEMNLSLGSPASMYESSQSITWV